LPITRAIENKLPIKDVERVGGVEREGYLK
jgi:hypothetical protein